METHKKVFFGVIAFLALAVVLGLISDWKYYGLTSILINPQEADESTQPKVKPPRKPNLMIENVFLQPKSPKVGDTIGLIAKIKNTGEQEIENVKIKITDQAGWGDTQKTAIQGDLYRYVKFELLALDVHVGEHDFSVEIDSNQQVEEENEEDNLYQLQLTVTQ